MYLDLGEAGKKILVCRGCVKILCLCLSAEEALALYCCRTQGWVFFGVVCWECSSNLTFEAMRGIHSHPHTKIGCLFHNTLRVLR